MVETVQDTITRSRTPLSTTFATRIHFGAPNAVQRAAPRHPVGDLLRQRLAAKDALPNERLRHGICPARDRSGARSAQRSVCPACGERGPVTGTADKRSRTAQNGRQGALLAEGLLAEGAARASHLAGGVAFRGGVTCRGRRGGRDCFGDAGPPGASRRILRRAFAREQTRPARTRQQPG